MSRGGGDTVPWWRHSVLWRRHSPTEAHSGVKLKQEVTRGAGLTDSETAFRRQQGAVALPGQQLGAVALLGRQLGAVALPGRQLGAVALPGQGTVIVPGQGQGIVGVEQSPAEAPALQ